LDAVRSVQTTESASSFIILVSVLPNPPTSELQSPDNRRAGLIGLFPKLFRESFHDVGLTTDEARWRAVDLGFCCSNKVNNRNNRQRSK